MREKQPKTNPSTLCCLKVSDSSKVEAMAGTVVCRGGFRYWRKWPAVTTSVPMKEPLEPSVITSTKCCRTERKYNIEIQYWNTTLNWNTILNHLSSPQPNAVELKENTIHIEIQNWNTTLNWNTIQLKYNIEPSVQFSTKCCRTEKNTIFIERF